MFEQRCPIFLGSDYLNTINPTVPVSHGQPSNKLLDDAVSKFEIWYGICHRKPRKNCIPHHRKSVTVLGIPCPFEPIHTHRSAFEVPFKECSLQTSSACRFVREPAQVRGSKKGISSCLRLPTFHRLASKEFLGCWQTADCGSVLHFFLGGSSTGEALLDFLSTKPWPTQEFKRSKTGAESD